MQSLTSPDSTSFARALPWMLASIAAAAGLTAVDSAVALPAAAILIAVGVIALAIRRPEMLVVALMGTAALDVSGRLASVGGVQVTLYQLTVLAAALLAGWLVVSGRAMLRVTAVDGAIAVFLLAAAVTVPGATEPRTALVGLISFVSSVLIIYLVSILAPTAQNLRAVLVGAMFVAGVLGVMAVIERLGLYSLQPVYETFADGIRARVTFKDPNILGGVLAAATASGLGLALSAKAWPRRLGLLAASAASGMGMLATLSRGAWLGFAVGAVIAVVLAPIRTRLKMALFGLGAAGVAAIAVFFLDPEWIASKVVGIAYNQSALYRIYLIESALRIFRDNPFGIGPGNWKAVYVAYRSAYLPGSLVESHTAYVTVLVETGIVGLLGFLTILGMWAARTARTALKASEDLRWLAGSALAGGGVLCVQAFTYSIEASKFLWFFVGVGLAVSAIARSASEEKTE